MVLDKSVREQQGIHLTTVNRRQLSHNVINKNINLKTGVETNKRNWFKDQKVRNT